MIFTIWETSPQIVKMTESLEERTENNTFQKNFLRLLCKDIVVNPNLYYYQNNSCAPEGVIGAHYMRFKPPFCRRLEGKEFCAFQRGTPSLAGRPLFQNSPPDCFEIHPLRSARCRGISLSAESDEGAALDPQALFRKGLDPKPF